MTENKMTVLYAEDDENDVFFMRRAFLGVWPKGELIVVPDGRLALDYVFSRGKFADHKEYPIPSLVLLDVKMPWFTGLEVVRAIRGRPELRDLPVVMLTSSLQSADIASAQASGASGYFAKPSNASELNGLLHAIAAALRSRAPGVAFSLNVSGNRLGERA